MKTKLKNNKRSDNKLKRFFSNFAIIAASILLIYASFYVSKLAFTKYNEHQVIKQIEIQKKSTLDEAVKYLKKKEGFREKPYHCKAGVKTIGYGDTLYLKEHPKTASITEEKAEKLLRQKIEGYLTILDTYQVTVGNKTLSYTKSLSIEQQVSLISFMYNVGEFNFAKSELRKKIDRKISTEIKLDKDYSKNVKYKKRLESDLKYVNSLIKREFLRWSNIKSGKALTKLEGLEMRRKEEAKMFLAAK